MTNSPTFRLHIARWARALISDLLSSVDDKSLVDSKAKLNRFSKIINSEVGKYSYVGPRTRLCNATVGSFCSVSWDCFIGLSSHESKLLSTSPIFVEKENGTGHAWVTAEHTNPIARNTTVGHDVWVGANCLILEGVQIGDGAIIGAGSVVTRDVAPYSIVGGVPARHIKFRFSEEIVAALLQKAWWNAPDREIRAAIRLFTIPDPSLESIAGLPTGSHNN